MLARLWGYNRTQFCPKKFECWISKGNYIVGGNGKWKTVLQLFKKLKKELPYDPAISRIYIRIHLRMYQRVHLSTQT